MIGTLFIGLRSLVYISGFVFLWGWLALGVRKYDEDLKISLPLWLGSFGILLMFLGGLTVLSCAWVFMIHGRGTPAVFDAPRQFVARGPYKFTRNPMYIGGTVLLTGFSFYHLSISMVIFSLALIFLFHLFVVFVEEPDLERRFGDSYFQYKKSTNRWMLKFRPSSPKISSREPIQ